MPAQEARRRPPPRIQPRKSKPDAPKTGVAAGPSRPRQPACRAVASVPIPFRPPPPADPREPPCAGCGRPVAPYARGLCRRCWADPVTRRKRGCRPWAVRRHGPPWEYAAGLPEKAPARRTAARPGEAAKVEVMAARRAAGAALFHPADADSDPVRLEAALLEMNVRACPGIETVVRKGLGERFRARPRHPKTGRRVHLGYFPDRVQATLEIFLWVGRGCPEDERPTPDVAGIRTGRRERKGRRHDVAEDPGGRW